MELEYFVAEMPLSGSEKRNWESVSLSRVLPTSNGYLIRFIKPVNEAFYTIETIRLINKLEV